VKKKKKPNRPISGMIPKKPKFFLKKLKKKSGGPMPLPKPKKK